MSHAEPRRLLLTGASSGIGLEAAKQMAARGHQLTILCRNQARSDLTLQALSGAAQTLICDLADLDAVRATTDQLLARGWPLDAVVLNAGLQYAGERQPRWSAQGIELTFAVNQLAHQVLATALLPLLRAASRPRVVITASEVHNPASGGGKVGKPAGLGDLSGLHQGAGCPMLDGSPVFDGDKAYKDSKLCNVLLARELNRRLEGAIPVMAWSPGLVIARDSRGFFRYSRQKNPLGMAAFAVVARDLLRLTESLPRAGALLTALCLDDGIATPGFSYRSNHLVRPGVHRFELVDTSAEATDLAKAAALWNGSEALLASL